jgi:glycerate 2-kinase
VTSDAAGLADRKLPLALFQAALAAVDGEAAVRDALDPARAPTHVVALGKAAAAMARGARTALGDGLARALVITRPGHLDADLCADVRVECLESAHPLPGARSLEAGAALLAFIDTTPRDEALLFLISGGTSSLVEVPVPGIDAERLAALNRWLLGAGLDIAAMNRVRSALSAIKGGRLAGRLGGRSARALLISDVPGDHPAVIGSGLLVAGEPRGEWPTVPGDLAWVDELAQAPLRPGDLTPPELEIVASLGKAMGAVVGAARARDLPVFRHDEFLADEAAATGERLARQLLGAEPGVHVWGGETHVHLPEHPGRGGRNQHLALAAARLLAGHRHIRLLAAGTDGSDGNSEDAGALVDGGTVARGEAQGLDAGECLACADSGRFLAASGDLIHTGPTGTNVMDLVIGVVAYGAVD